MGVATLARRARAAVPAVLGTAVFCLSAALIPLLLSPSPAWADAPTFQGLMDPAVFPEPQRGMAVEGAGLTNVGWQVTTTGARITADVRRGEVLFEQRIGHPRAVARVRIDAPMAGARMTHSRPGFARIACDQPRMTVRVNGDSLFMLHAHEPLEVKIDSEILPAWFASYGSNHLLSDEWGGFGVYCSDASLPDEFEPWGRTVVRYKLPADSVLWVAVCPPKPYPWQRSLRDNVVWHWSDRLAYPPDDVLTAWQAYGNIVLLQSEVMLWKDWNLDFAPRLGPEEFARVRQTLHGMGTRFIVYASPFYFLKGTALESQAMNSFEGFKGWPPGTSTGENIDLFMDAITRLMKEHRPDGLYFDGQYSSNPAALYALARRARALIGEDGILEWHSTQALGREQCYLPQADAYVDFILRGEGMARFYSNFDYLRFFVSAYNVSNSIGVLCNNDNTLTSQLAHDVLEANARFHTLAAWLDRPDLMAILRRDYQPYLTPELQQRVEAAADRRQREVAARAARYRAEWEALKSEPPWDKPNMVLTFEALPCALQVVSLQNPQPFMAVDGRLKIWAHAHTHAFYSFPICTAARGLVIRLRQGTDGGMSWGPAAMLRFANGAKVRIGTRSDGRVEAEITGEQFLAGGYDAREWVWLRVRWLDRWGVVERSNDGKNYQMLWRFEHAGNFGDALAELLVGKVPYNGQPEDYAEAGPTGECEIDLVQVY